MWSIRIYIALSGVVLGFIIAIAAAFLLIPWKRRKQISGKMGDLELQKLSLSVRSTSEKKISFDQNSRDTLDGHVIVDVITPRKMLVECYTLDELSRATENFSSSNLIEGSVFHGGLNGKNLAIKRTHGEYLSKVDFGLLTDRTHHHPNLVRLIGTCSSEGPNGFLVFEYARNGSLKDWLHGGLAVKSQFIASCYCFLGWNQRLRICLDVATALHYMHQIMIPSYVHCNIKSRNIFLDEEFNAKVGNFGMTSCFEEEEEESEDGQSSSSLANQFSWSEGYLAPEYLRDGTVAPSIDIFAYGVVLLELMSGQTPMTRSEKKGEDYVRLANNIRGVLRSEGSKGLREWMDPAMGENYSFEAAVTLANLAGACVEDDPSMRPSAGEIVEKLSRLVEMPPEGDQFPAGESSTKPLVMSTRNQSI